MSNRNTDLLRPLIFLINTLLTCCIFFFIYLVGGNFIGDWFTLKKPVAQKIQRGSINDFEIDDRVVDGIHLETGLVYAEGFDLVRGTCTGCHSAKLVTQNRASKEGWEQMIRWMQETQGLWDLGKNEPKIINYLATHYAPEETGRRPNIDISEIEWYILDIEE